MLSTTSAVNDKKVTPAHCDGVAPSPRSAPIPWFLLLSIITLTSIPFTPGITSSPLFAQDGGEEETDPSEEEKRAQEEARKAAEAAARELAERIEGIRSLFNASKMEFDPDGSVALTYEFEESDKFVARDWGPEIERFKKRVRWSRGWEGGGSRVYRDDTIVISEYGTWLHKAKWKEVDVEVEFHMITEIMKPGDIVAAVYSWNKNKRLVGSNIGEQILKLNASPKRAGSGIPRAFPLMHADEERTFGYRLKDGVFTATHSGRNTVDTTGQKSFLKKLTPGHVGFSWRGEYMKGFLLKVSMKGELDEEWLSDQLKSKS